LHAEDMKLRDNEKDAIHEIVEEVDQDPETQLGHTRRSFFGFSIAGNDEEPGPIFNYARVWSHTNAVAHFVRPFASAIEFKANNALSGVLTFNHGIRTTMTRTSWVHRSRCRGTFRSSMKISRTSLYTQILYQLFCGIA
jgi:hypothetical protein